MSDDLRYKVGNLSDLKKIANDTESLIPSNYNYSIFVSSNFEGNIRWNNDSIEVIRWPSEEDIDLNVSLYKGISKSTSHTSLNNVSDIKECIDLAKTHSKDKSTVDKHFSSYPKPQNVKPYYHDHDRFIDLDKMLMKVEDSIDSSLEENYKGNQSGALYFCASKCFVMNSEGINVGDKNVNFYMSATTKTKNGEGIGFSNSSILSKLDGRKAGRESSKMALFTNGITKPKEGSYSIILGPYATNEILQDVFTYECHPENFYSGNTSFFNKFEKKISSEEFNLSDNGRFRNGLMSKEIDDEGIPTRKTKIIEDGIFKNIINNSETAEMLKSPNSLLPKHNFKTTGNGSRKNYHQVNFSRYADESVSLEYSNIVIGKGDQSLEEIISDTKKGIIVDRVWYTRDGKNKGDFTTTLRGGLKYIKNGKILGNVKSDALRWEGNMLNLLRNIEAVGKEQYQSWVWDSASSVVAPYLKVGKQKLLSYPPLLQ